MAAVEKRLNLHLGTHDLIVSVLLEFSDLAVLHPAVHKGLRVALGADRGQVVRMVIGEGMALVGTGVILGLLLSTAAMQPVSRFVIGVGATDGLTFATVSVVLGAVALLASYVPARRAARVDPMVALRYD